MGAINTPLSFIVWFLLKNGQSQHLFLNGLEGDVFERKWKKKSMSLRPDSIGSVLEETVRVAQAIFWVVASFSALCTLSHRLAERSLENGTLTAQLIGERLSQNSPSWSSPSHPHAPLRPFKNRC
jgi:hypothetical protein